MGQNKLPLEVGGVSLLERAYDALSARCKEVLIVGGREDDLLGRLPGGARFVPDLRPGEGPLAGVEAGLRVASHESVFVAAGDLPFLPGRLVGYLLGLLSAETPAVVPRLEGRLHPLCAAYDRGVRAAASAALDRGERSMRGFVEGLPGMRCVGEDELRRFGAPEVLLANVNSPEDLARARRAPEGGASRGAWP